jgi:predicted DNA-binding transcriptional regulator YafY
VASTVSPTARALQTLEILQMQPGTTAGQIAERLGVTERAARRYIAILREAGIPVESARGRYGGYRLGRGMRLPPVIFTQDEALGLVMAVLEGHPAATGTGGLAGSALAKVIRALPENVGRQAAALREHASAAPGRRNARPDPAVTSALVVASASNHRVRLKYSSAPGREWEAEVDPWAVVVRHGLWYLLCYSHHAGAVRSYRIDRVRMVEPTRASFAAPDGLDPVAALEENLGEGWDFPVRIVFKAVPSQVAPWIRAPMGRLEPHVSGCVLVGSTSNPAMYAQEWLAAVPFDFCVEGGDELRAAVAALASRCAAAVSASPAGSRNVPGSLARIDSEQAVDGAGQASRVLQRGLASAIDADLDTLARRL